MSGAEILYQGMTEIDDDLIEMAQNYSYEICGIQKGVQNYDPQRYGVRKKNFWIRWGYSICAAIIVAVLLTLPMNRVMVEDPGVIKEEQIDGEQSGASQTADIETKLIEDYSGQETTGSAGGVVGESQAAKETLIVNETDQMISADMDVRSVSLLTKMPEEVYEECWEDFRATMGIGCEEFQASIFPESIWETRDVIRLLNGNHETADYQMHDYVFYFKKKADRVTVKVAACAFEEPLRDYYISCDTPGESMLKQGISAVVYKWQDMLIAQFVCRGIHMDVETNGLAEEELAELLNRIVMSGVHSQSYSDTADVPVDESTYHEARTYSAEIMDLQERISQAMVDRELPFVISSAIRENPDRIVVTVTTQDEALLAELRAYDTTGKLLEIQFAGENGQALKEDMAVLE